MTTTALAPDTTPLRTARTTLMRQAAEISKAGAQCQDFELLSAANILIEQALVAIKGDTPPTVEQVEPSTKQKLLAKYKPTGREITLGNSQAREMHVFVKGQIMRVVLPNACYNMNLVAHRNFARKLGGRLATREESRAVARVLLEKEKNGTLNTAETDLLTKYRKNFLRDSEGVIGVDGRRVIYDRHRFHNSFPDYGALIALPLAESI